MPKRRDGLATRDQLLAEAVEVFAEHGYHKAPVSEICRRAGANGAAINYYFGDKWSLYTAVWRQYAGRLFKFSENLPAVGRPAEQLAACIRGLIRQMADQSRAGSMHRLHLHEIINPTGLMDEMMRQYREPFRRKLMQIIGKLLGPDTSPRAIQQCEISITSQCRSVLMLHKHPELIGKRKFTTADVNRMADHVIAFSLGGIDRIKRTAKEGKR